MKRNLRGFRSQTERQLLVGFFVLLLLVGDGLIWLIYGGAAALVGMLCITGGIALLLLLWGVLSLIDRVSRRWDG